MRQDELHALLDAFAADRLALLERQEAGARAVANYDFNNTYQYIIAREETHLEWLQSALGESGEPTLPSASAEIAVPPVPKARRGGDSSIYRAVLEDDARHLSAFVQRWREKVEGIEHARHRTMLRVILGESLEHQRLFEQAAGGLEDVIGRRTVGAARVGAVLPTRWQE